MLTLLPGDTTRIMHSYYGGTEKNKSMFTYPHTNSHSRPHKYTVISFNHEVGTAACKQDTFTLGLHSSN